MGAESNYGPSVALHEEKYYLAAAGPLKGALHIFSSSDGKKWDKVTAIPDQDYTDYGVSLASDGIQLVLSWIGAVGCAVNILRSADGGRTWTDHNRIPGAISRNAPALSTVGFILPTKG